MTPLAKVLEHAAMSTDCTWSAVHGTHANSRCEACAVDSKQLEKNNSKELCEARRQGLISYKPFCGWVLSARGRQIWAQLNGDFE